MALSQLNYRVKESPFFDCGSIARVAREVEDATRNNDVSDWKSLVSAVRRKVATILAPADYGATRVEPLQVTLFHNTTGAVQRVLRQVHRRLGGTCPSLLTSDLEFPGCLAAIDESWDGTAIVAELAKDIMQFAGQSEIDPSVMLEESLTRAFNFVKPQVVYLSHVMRTTGQEVALSTLRYFREANPRVIIILDGSQALGNIVVSPDILNAVDFYIASGHKWLGGMTTCGIAWTRDPDYWNLEDPAQAVSYSGHQGGTGNHWSLYSLLQSLDDMFQHRPAARQAEIATHNRSLTRQFHELITSSDISRSVRVDSPSRTPNGLTVIEHLGRGMLARLQDDHGIHASRISTEVVPRRGGKNPGSSRLIALQLLRDEAPLLRLVGETLSILPTPIHEKIRLCFHFYHDTHDVHRLFEAIQACRK